LLLQRPNLLLLDEPTNHLDLPARDWLENYLADYPYAVVLVSHDRFFLDRVVNRIVELWNGALTEYSGNYSAYLTEREQRITALRAARARQDEEITRIEAFISRFRYQANKAAQVQSRIKQLEKIERIEVPPERRQIAFKFPAPPKGGRKALELENIEHGYGDLSVLQDVCLDIERGERVALVGANGAGKSTLMRLLAGIEAPRSGFRSEGHNLHLAYFAQDQARVLNPDHTVLEELTAAAPFDMVPQVRNILGAFLFSGDDVHKPVAVLSGGERNRLALAMLLLRPANLLLLDEPTNHLDLQSKDVLLRSLLDYEGTLVFVSHDRYFVDRLATRVVEVGYGRAVSHLGNYEDFLRAKAADGDNSHSADRVEQRQMAQTVEAVVAASADSYQERKAYKREQRRRQKLLAEVESLIESGEENLAQLEAKLAVPDLYDDPEEARRIAEEYQALQDEIGELYHRWESLQLEESA
jgi:ATP-binding cassette subfamily F protein 3